MPPKIEPRIAVPLPRRGPEFRQKPYAMTLLQFTLRLCAAFLLGGVIGLERQFRQKNAGLRTNTLVSLGSAGFILLSASLVGDSGDPSRIAAQIVTGVGFLGGGLILKDGLSVRGLNTAATIWCSAAVGSMCGVGLFPQAAILVSLIVVAHCFFRPLGYLIGRHSCAREEEVEYGYTLTIRCREDAENRLRFRILHALEQDPDLQLRSLNSRDDEIPSYSYVTAKIRSCARHDRIIEKLAAALTIEYGVTQVHWENERIGGGE